jgi:hypothetical protein
MYLLFCCVVYLVTVLSGNQYQVKMKFIRNIFKNP